MIKKICDISKDQYDFYLDFGKMPIANSFNIQKKFQTYYNCIIGINYKHKILKNINVPKPKKLFTDYYPYSASLSKKFSHYLSDLALEISEKNKLELKDKFIIEIGSSDGMFLEYFNKKKIRHLGIEPTLNNHRIAKKKGVNSINDFFDYKFSKKISKKYGKADIIFSSNVIAHINHINDTFKGINEILNDNGIFIFENIYLLDLIKNLSFDQLYDEHVYTISVTAINEIAKKNGLNLFSVKRTKIQGGSIRYYITKDILKRKHGIVDKYIFKESTNPFFKKKNPNIFFNKCLKIKNDIHNLLSKIKKQDKKIIGYGASAKATFLINFCNLNESSLDYIFDSSKEKNNKYLPGTLIKIKHEKEISKQSFDYVIVFAWNHFDEIKQKNINNMKKNNAKWIMTFPKVRILK